MQTLLNQIEEKRKEMIRFFFVYGMSSPQTIKTSQELDVLINLYQNKIVSKLQHNFKAL